MLMSNEFVKAEDKYRRESLRDQYQTDAKGRVGKAVTALVVAGAIALAACGVPAQGSGAVQSTPAKVTTDLEHAFSGTPAPMPQGSRGLMSAILGPETADLETVFSGIAAPVTGIGAITLPQQGDAELRFSGVEAPSAEASALGRQHAEAASGPR